MSEFKVRGWVERLGHRYSGHDVASQDTVAFLLADVDAGSLFQHLLEFFLG